MVSYLLGREPEVELRHPILDCVDRDNAEHGARHRVAQEDVHEGDDLHCLA